MTMADCARYLAGFSFAYARMKYDDLRIDNKKNYIRIDVGEIQLNMYECLGRVVPSVLDTIQKFSEEKVRLVKKVAIVKN